MFLVLTNFTCSAQKDTAICKLCYNHELSITSSNTFNALKQHIKTIKHRNNVKEFEKDELDFPYAFLNLEHQDYQKLIRKSAVREGKL